MGKKIFAKRIFDLIVSLILLLPIISILIIAIVLIRIDSPGPAIFKQKRLGKNGREFVFFKLRSMYENADDLLRYYLDENSEIRGQWDKYAKIKKNDPRVTKVGAFIRKYSIDELPQILNVLRGEMSLVGPRPYLPREKDSLAGWREILQMAPGITGYWQVNGRNDVDFTERLRMDSWYVRNWSLTLDFIILLGTFKVVLLGKGAY